MSKESESLIHNMAKNLILDAAYLSVKPHKDIISTPVQLFDGEVEYRVGRYSVDYSGIFTAKGNVKKRMFVEVFLSSATTRKKTDLFRDSGIPLLEISLKNIKNIGLTVEDLELLESIIWSELNDFSNQEWIAY